MEGIKMNSRVEDTKPHILVFDDSETHREVMQVLLESDGWEVKTASHSAAAITVVNDLEGPAVVLLDRNFTDKKGNPILGENVLQELSDRARYPIVTFFFSGDHSEEAQIAAYDAGAYGYLMKGSKPPLISAKIRRAAAFVRQIVEPTLDHLTGVLNRRYAIDRIVRELHRSDREGTANACVVVDINNLKKANDEYGHQAGDNLIKAVASSIKLHTRQTDVVCRMGGDEFLIFLADQNPKTHQKDTKSFVRNFLATLGTQKITISGQGGVLPVSASIGVSLVSFKKIKETIRKARLKNPQKLDEALVDLAKCHIKMADRKMYEEKKKQKAKTESGG